MLLDRVPFNRGVAPPFPTLPLPPSLVLQCASKFFVYVSKTL